MRARTLAALLCGAGLVLAGAAVRAETPGDATRGRALFEEKGCGRCHRPQAGERGVGPPRETLRRPQGLFELAGRLWNHVPTMRRALGTMEGLPWPELTLDQVGDLAAYLEADPARDPAGDPARGQVTLIRKGCLKCHRLRGEGGAVGPELTAYRDRFRSPTAWGATVWNHSPRMAEHAARLGVLYPRFSGEEMSDLVAFLRQAAGG
jgi:cytochrome c551/c552